jgi:hypothetical protein
MKTLFFEWRKISHLMVANDPFDEDQRWIIRAIKNNPDKFELIRVKFGKATPVIDDKNIEFLMWQATVAKLSSINDFVHRAPYLLDKSKIQKMEELLFTLNQAYESATKGESSASPQEESCST